MVPKFEVICLNKKYEDDWLINKFTNAIMLFHRYRHMHPDDLKAIWICHECRTIFVFHSDIDDHKNLTRHEKIEKVMMTISPTETSA
jgi:hypothetical protein